MTTLQEQVDQVHELDRLIIQYQENQTEENWVEYQMALSAHQNRERKQFWKKAPDPAPKDPTPSRYPRFWIYNALTRDVMGQPLETLLRWRELTLDVWRRIQTLENRLMILDNAITERKAEKELGVDGSD